MCYNIFFHVSVLKTIRDSFCHILLSFDVKLLMEIECLRKLDNAKYRADRFNSILFCEVVVRLSKRRLSSACTCYPVSWKMYIMFIYLKMDWIRGHMISIFLTLFDKFLQEKNNELDREKIFNFLLWSEKGFRLCAYWQRVLISLYYSSY